MSSNEIKIYIRNGKKYGKILTIPSEISAAELYRLAAASQDLNAQDVQLIISGKPLLIETEIVQLQQKAIVHVINLHEVNKDSLTVNIRSLQSTNVNKIETDSNCTIRQFINEKLLGIYGEKSDKLILVHIGRQLDLSRTFRQEKIQNESELFCVNSQQLKNRRKIDHKQKQDLSVKDLQVPEEPKNIYPHPNFTIDIPTEVNASNNFNLVYDSKVRHATSLPIFDLEPNQIIVEQDVLATKISQEQVEENQQVKIDSGNVDGIEEKGEIIDNKLDGQQVEATEDKQVEVIEDKQGEVKESEVVQGKVEQNNEQISNDIQNHNQIVEQPKEEVNQAKNQPQPQQQQIAKQIAKQDNFKERDIQDNQTPQNQPQEQQSLI